MAILAIPNLSTTKAAARASRTAKVGPGNYLGRIRGLVMGEAKSGSGNTVITMELEIVRLKSGKATDFAGMSCMYWYSFGEERSDLPQFRKLCDDCGVKPGKKDTIDTKALIGKLVFFRVDHETQTDVINGREVTMTNARVSNIEVAKGVKDEEPEDDGDEDDDEDEKDDDDDEDDDEEDDEEEDDEAEEEEDDKPAKKTKTAASKVAPLGTKPAKVAKTKTKAKAVDPDDDDGDDLSDE